MQAFDGSSNSKWLDFGAGSGAAAWLEGAATAPLVGARLVGYTLVAAGDAPERDPRDWVLEGLPCAHHAPAPGEAAVSVAPPEQSRSWIGLDAQQGAKFTARGQELHYQASADLETFRIIQTRGQQESCPACPQVFWHESSETVVGIRNHEKLVNMQQRTTVYLT